MKRRRFAAATGAVAALALSSTGSTAFAQATTPGTGTSGAGTATSSPGGATSSASTATSSPGGATSSASTAATSPGGAAPGAGSSTGAADGLAPPAADERTPVDVVTHDPSPSRRIATVEWNPLALVISRISLNVQIAPAEHHAIVLTPFYFYPHTASFQSADAAGNPVIVPGQTFRGFGGEIGYRYYTGRGGLRGFYAGPSVFVEFPKAKAGNGEETAFTDLGVAADVGYEALVAGRWVVSVGAGVQYTFTSQSIARQQMPATVVANRGVQPRFDFSVGYAF